ncbi:MAG: EAL domain-containing protein [Blastocatellia bacterium]
MNRKRFTDPFMLLVTVVGGTALVCSVMRLPFGSLDLRFWLLALFTVTCSSRLIVRIPHVKGEITVSDTMIFLTLLLYGGEAAVLLAATETVFSSWRVSKRMLTFVFNVSMLSCSTFLTAVVLHLNFGSVTELAQKDYSPNYVAMICVMALVQYITNAGIAAVRSAFATNQTIIQTWTNGFLWTSITYFAGASAAGFIARLNGAIGVYAMIVSTPIIAIVYFTYRTWLRNVEVSREKAVQAEQHVAELNRYIAEQERISRALRESEEHFRSAFDQAAGMALVSPEWRWLKVNQSLCNMLGYTEQEMLDTSMQQITHPEDLGSDLTSLYSLIEGRLMTSQIEKRYRHRAGQDVWVLQSASLVRDMENKPLHFIFQIQDITDRKQAEEKIHYAAFHDALTGLPNRILLNDRLSIAVERAKRHADYQFAVLFIDLDRFKIVNDSLGHQYGDELLVQVSKRLRECVRAVDTVARLGGDEFAILLDGIEGVENAAPTAERIQEQLTAPFSLLGHEVFISGSIGIAFSRNGYTQPEDVLRDSDTAMYRAKSNGKARHEFFDQSMHSQALEQLQLENDLRRAIERREFQVYYQPIVSLSDQQIRGFEALVRWHHPQRGLVPPVEFVPFAEETGMITLIGLFVMSEACRQIAEWQRQFPAQQSLTISVNLSPRQLKEADVAERIGLILRESGLQPSCLRLEITEGLVMENTERAAQILTSLKALGVQLSLDDFGTGYSSLSYLHRFPFDILKVDRSFVMRLGQDQSSNRIIKTILLLASEMNMSVVAEGVETVSQLEYLCQMGCPSGQGYLFSKPVPGPEAEALLSRQLQESVSLPATQSDQPATARVMTSSYLM